MEGETNGDAFDRFTIAHAGFGALLGVLRVTPVTAAVIAVGWEFLERPLKDRFPQVFPNATQDTLQNAAGDVLGVLVGYALSRGLR